MIIAIPDDYHGVVFWRDFRTGAGIRRRKGHKSRKSRGAARTL